MATIEILDSGRIDERESAFPMAVQLPAGDLLCSFGVGGGALVTGHTEWARSTDRGKNWSIEGTILPPDDQQGRANFLKLTVSEDRQTVFAYGAWIDANTDEQFGQRDSRALLCRSLDGGLSWSDTTEVLFPEDCPLEVSHGLLALEHGRLLAPAATLPAADRLGEKVFVALSDDDGASWNHQVPFHDPAGELGYFEQKFARLPGGCVMGVAWTVTLGDYLDQENSFVISRDNGSSWGPIQPTGIRGQTMTPLSLGEDRLLVFYNRRHGDQAIMACLVTFSDHAWTVHQEQVMYDAKTHYVRPESVQSGVDELDDFAFGFPTGIVLDDGSILATHWCVEGGACGIRWTRLSVDW